MDRSWQCSCLKGWLGGRIWLLFCKECWAMVAEDTDWELAWCCFEQWAVQWTFRRKLLQLWCLLFPLAAGGLDLPALHYSWMAGKPWEEATTLLSSSLLLSSSASSLILKGCHYPSLFSAREKSTPLPSLFFSYALKLEVRMAAPFLGWTVSFWSFQHKSAVLKFSDHERSSHWNRPLQYLSPVDICWKDHSLISYFHFLLRS